MTTTAPTTTPAAPAAAPAVTAYLGLGGNLGDRAAALAAALECLDETPGLRRIAVSDIYETEPWGVTDQPPFLNLAAAYETALPPVALLSAVKRVEAQVGRAATYRWGPRLIDVDILLYGSRVVAIASPDLRIPHIRLAERAFALVPLAEIAPDAPVPPAGRSVRQLLCAVAGEDGVRRWGDAPPAGF